MRGSARLEDIAVWAGVIVPVLFAVQYTWLSRWWRNPTGISIVALDFCIWTIFGAHAVWLGWPGFAQAHVLDLDWAQATVAIAAPLVIIYRMLAFEARRRRLSRRDRLMLVPSPRHDGNGNGTPARRPRSEDSGAA